MKNTFFLCSVPIPEHNSVQTNSLVAIHIAAKVTYEGVGIREMS